MAKEKVINKVYFKKQYNEALVSLGEDYKNVPKVTDISGYEPLSVKLRRMTAFDLRVATQYDGVEGNEHDVDITQEPGFELADAGQVADVIMSRVQKKPVKTQKKAVVAKVEEVNPDDESNK